jgi:hypothetical protein
MKRSSRLISLAIAGGLLPCFASTSIHAEPSTVAGTPNGGHSPVYMSDNGVSTNPQWSADPEKGWVRAGERDRRRERNDLGQFKNNSKQKYRGIKDKVKDGGRRN